jgi:hypothetical protein
MCCSWCRQGKVIEAAATSGGIPLYGLARGRFNRQHLIDRFQDLVDLFHSALQTQGTEQAQLLSAPFVSVNNF